MLKENLEFDFSGEISLSRESSRTLGHSKSSGFSKDLGFQEQAASPEKLSPHLRKIHEQACHRARKYLVAEADLLDSIIQVDRNKIYQELGLPFLSHYCEKVLGLTHEVGGSFIRVARKSHEVPALQKAVSEGLSLTKAKTIVSVLKGENQEVWIERAKTLSKHQLEKEVVKIRPNALSPEKAKPVGENRNRLEFELNDEELCLQRRAQDLVSQKLGKSASLAETQALLLECFLKHHDPVRKAKRAKVRSEKKAVLNKKPKAHEKVESGPSGRTGVNDDSSEHSHRSRERSYQKNPSRRKALPAHVQHAVHERDQGKCQERLAGGISE